jgi:hypothetical protein
MTRFDDSDSAGEWDDEALFLSRMRAVLDDSVGSLSASELSCLDQARRAALLSSEMLDSLHASRQESVIRLLDESAGQIPARVVSQLDVIRAQAMLRARRVQMPVPARNVVLAGLLGALNACRLIPVGAIASVFVLATTLIVFNLRESSDGLPLVLADEALLVSSAEELELYENLEFYQWLADNGL